VNEADIQTVEVVSDDPERKQMEMLAKLAAQLLTKHYPNHVWMVGWAPGLALVIKYMGADARFGYTVDCAAAHSISQLEKAVVMGGGELLERLGMKRGAWDGELPQQQYEGAAGLLRPVR
jgi:hypothetical protein